MQRLLRDHGSESSYFEAYDSDHEHERYFTVCAHSEPVHTTAASMVASESGAVE